MDYQAHLTGRIDEIQKKLRECNYECNRMKEEIAEFVAQTQAKAIQQPPKTESKVTEIPPVVETPVLPAVEVEKTPPPVADQTIPKTPAVEQVFQPLTESAPKFVPSREVPKTPIAATAEAKPATKPAKPKKDADAKSEFERFIGENILNKIGIAILVIGIGFFIKLSIDRDMLGPIGRVLVGILSGGVMLATAHLLRKTYKAFSSVVLGGGMVTLYFTTFAAFQYYQLIPQAAAFAILIFLTLATVMFSIAYDRQEIAMVALLGGFAAPFLVSTGDGNFKVLFSYLAILNAGMLLLSTLRKWRVVNISSFVLTAVVFGVWQFFDNAFHPEPHSGWALLFATVFFLEFFAMNVIYQSRTKQSFDVLAYILLIANTAYYFCVGFVALSEINEGLYQGMFTALLGAFHLVAIILLRNLFQADRNLVLLLIGMVVTFLTLAIPIQLDGQFITLFWAAEAVVLLWLSRRLKIDLMFVTSMIVSGLAIIALILDWNIAYGNSSYYLVDDIVINLRQPFANKYFLTSLFVSAALIVIHLMERNRAKQDGKHKELGYIFLYVSLPVVYFSFLLEFLYLGGRFWGEHALAVLLGGAYTAVFASGMMLYAMASRQKVLGFISMGLGGLLVLVTPFLLQAAVHTLWFKTEPSHATGYSLHFLLYLSLLVMVLVSLLYVVRSEGLRSGFGQVFTWLFTASLTTVLSLELTNILVGAGVERAIIQKAFLAILWGGIGFVLIYQGLRHKLIQFRLAALALFGLTLLKLFAYDVWSISPVGRIAAFISLGIVLLVISFMYNRLRNIILKGETEAEMDETTAEDKSQNNDLP